MSKDDERVLCVPRSVLESLFDSPGSQLFSGFRYQNPDQTKLTTILNSGHASFVRRGDCEQDPGLKQIIPYIVLTCNAYSYQQIFRYNRAVKGEGEQRLAGKATVGIGGHINDVDHDGDFVETFQKAWRRELREEVVLGSAFTASIAGFLNDDSDAVGSVHFGVVVRLSLELPCVYPNEPNIVRPHFMPRWPLHDRPRSQLELSLFESWSQIVLDSRAIG